MVKQQKKNMRRRSSTADEEKCGDLQLDAKHLNVSEHDMKVVQKHRMSTLVAAKTAERANVLLNSIDKCDDVWEHLEKLEVSSAAAVILVTPFIISESLVKITNRAVLGPLARLFNLDDRCCDDSEDEEEEEEDCHDDSEDDHCEDEEEEEEDCHYDSEDDHCEDEEEEEEEDCHDSEDDHCEDEDEEDCHSNNGCKHKKKKKKNFLARLWCRLYKKDKKKCKRKCRK